jgi:hypothetical protein
MKNLFKFSLVLGVALLTMNVHASDIDFSLGVKKEQGKVITFVFSETNKLNLSIYDTEGKMIHTENVDSQTFINRTYDLNALPEGIYYLVAESEYKISKYKISVVGTTARLLETPISEEFKPVFTEKDGLLKLSFLNLDKSPTFVKIYDKEDNLVYDSGMLTDQNIAKTFDVYTNQNEAYTFVVTNNNKSYAKTFYKR